MKENTILEQLKREDLSVQEKTASGERRSFRKIMDARLQQGHQDCHQLLDSQQTLQKYRHEEPLNKGILLLYPTKELALEQSRVHLQCLERSNAIVPP